MPSDERNSIMATATFFHCSVSLHLEMCSLAHCSTYNSIFHGFISTLLCVSFISAFQQAWVYLFTGLEYWIGTLEWTTGLTYFWFSHIFNWFNWISLVAHNGLCYINDRIKSFEVCWAWMWQYNLFVVCPKCSCVYNYNQCIETRAGRIIALRCRYVAFPNHVRRDQREPCNSPLLKEIKIRNGNKEHLVPIKIICTKI